MKGLPSKHWNNAWERGEPKETRPGGFRLPYINPRSGQPMGQKEFSQKRHEIAALRDRQRNDPTIYADDQKVFGTRS